MSNNDKWLEEVRGDFEKLFPVGNSNVADHVNDLQWKSYKADREADRGKIAGLEKENLELKALVSDSRSWVLYNLKCALNESEEISAEVWLKKAEKYKQKDSE